jgi:hypothetical protein
MTDHLPECPVPGMDAAHGPLHPEDAEANCICTELRACEQRVLDAAREAVKAALPHADDCRAFCSCCMGDYVCNCERYEALAAIDALRGEQP